MQIVLKRGVQPSLRGGSRGTGGLRNKYLLKYCQENLIYDAKSPIRGALSSISTTKFNGRGYDVTSEEIFASFIFYVEPVAYCNLDH
jgi:hypothetical protein